MNTRSTPISYSELTAYYPSLFNLTGGWRTYGLNGASNSVIQYLPAPTAGTRLRFFAVDITNAVYVKAKAAAKILGSATESIQLENVGDCVELVSNDAGTAWIPLNFGTINVRP